MSTTILKELAQLQALDLAADSQTILDQLRPCMQRYAELEMRPDGSRIDLITLSDQLKEIDLFLDILRKRMPGEEGISRVNSLINFGAGHTMGMKLPLAGDLAQGELYIRGALPFEEVRFFLSNQGVKAELLDRLAAVGNSFEKEYCHMLSADVGTTEFSVFFTTYLKSGEEATDASMLEKAMTLLEVNEAGQQNMMRMHGMLGAARPCTLFLSIKITQEQILGAKVDYPSIRVGSIAELMQTIVPDANGRLPIYWGQTLDAFKSNFTGVMLDKNGPRSLRAYFPYNY